MAKTKGYLSAHQVLWIMVFWGFAVNYMIRVNMNIAIVEMARKSYPSATPGAPSDAGSQRPDSRTAAACYVQEPISTVSSNLSTSSAPLTNFTLATTSALLPNISTSTVPPVSVKTEPSSSNVCGGDFASKLWPFTNFSRCYEIIWLPLFFLRCAALEKMRYDRMLRVMRSYNRASCPCVVVSDLNAVAGMNEYEQGLVLGAFFWMFWLTQLPGGVLASRYGTKIVFGWTNAFPGVIGMLIPLAAGYGVWSVVVLRVLQGMLAGFTWPSMHHMTAQWVPPDKRSKFVSAYLGSSLGAALTFPACGSLMAWAGWPAVFYASGVISVLWAAAWYLLVFDSPAQHPRISPAERSAIEDALRNQVHSAGTGRLRTPWIDIITSVPVWMNICAQFGAIWGLFTLLTQAPTYFRRIHGWGIHMTGILSGVPHLCRTGCALIVSYVGDWLIRSEKMSRTNVRKAATALCNVVMGIFILMLAWSGCNATAAAIFLNLATTANGAVSTGVLASMVDISPNFASIVMGVCSLITTIPGFTSPYIVGLLTLNNQTTEAWKMVYLIAGLLSIVTGFMFILFADSEVQPWNSAKDEKGQELRLIQNGKVINEPKYLPVSKDDMAFDESSK